MLFEAKLWTARPWQAIHVLCPPFSRKPTRLQEPKTALQEVVEDAGHIFELYPKYHCECNWIEMYWGGAKRNARLNCDYTFKSLEANIDSFLDNAGDITKIRRYYKRCMNYIEAYGKCKDGCEVAKDVLEFVQKTYLSHRKVRFEEI
jgi:hypothetical protein